MSRVKVPYLPNLEPLIQAGINPKTGLPYKIDNGAQRLDLLYAIERDIERIELDEYTTRYKWFNLPSTLTGEMVEKMLYNKGQLAFFYMKENDTFYLLPYALEGNIDCYGRFVNISPLPYGNGTVENEKGKEKPWISGLVKHVEYDIVLEEDMTLDIFDNSCVILRDYTPQYGETCIPRSELNRGIRKAEAECFPMARTNLISNSGIKGMRVPDADSESQVNNASEKMYNAAMTGNPYMAIIGGIDFQELGGGSTMKSEEFLLYMQSLNNFRMSTLGLGGGLFEKKSHVLNSEQEMNTQNVGLVYQSGLSLRQKFCDIVNSIWGLGIWCEPSETVTNFDSNMDGKLTDENVTQPQTNMNTGGVDEDVV